MRWLLSRLERDLGAINEKLDRTQAEQMKILVGQIDRVRSLEDSITRVDVAVRILQSLDIDFERIGKRKD